MVQSEDGGERERERERECVCVTSTADKQLVAHKTHICTYLPSGKKMILCSCYCFHRSCHTTYLDRKLNEEELKSARHFIND